MKRNKRSVVGLLLVFVVGVYVGTHIPSLTTSQSYHATTTEVRAQMERDARRSEVNSDVVKTVPSSTGSGDDAEQESSPADKKARNVDPDDPDEKIHVLFPSGCNAFQQWQAELLLWSHWKTGQKGKITRIVHGCEDTSEVKDTRHLPHPGGDLHKNQDVSVLEASTHPHFTLYSTPGTEGAQEFPYFNKPFSIDYFAKNGQKVWDKDDIIVILDIDEVFIPGETLTQRPLPLSELQYSDQPDEEVTNVVAPGRPVGQMYGLGGVDFLDKAELCGEGSKCAQTEGSGWNRFTVGPPLFVHMSDLHGVAKHWQEYTKPIFKVNPIQLSEMYAYMAGAANLGLKQVRLEHYMVSAPGEGVGGEGWPRLEEWDSLSCRKPSIPEGKKAPTFLHYCQTYAAYDKDGNRWLWHKGHVPHNILDCDSPILKAPPDDLYNTQETPRGKRNAWLVCYMHYLVNAMLKDYKQKFCRTGNDKIILDERVRLIHGGTEGLECGPKGCYPLAQYEPDDNKVERVPRDPGDHIYVGD